MKTSGSFPIGAFADDLTIERELLEAPSAEPTLLGGFQAACIDLPPTRRHKTLGELLEEWHDENFGARACAASTMRPQPLPKN